jgi:hypothetical protein
MILDCFFFHDALLSHFIFCDALELMFLPIKVIVVMILTHFPPFHVHSIMSLVGVNVLKHAHLLVALPLLPI